MDWAVIIPAVGTMMATVIVAVGTIVVPIILARMKATKESADAAANAAATAATAAIKLGQDTGVKLDDVSKQLNGRLSQLLSKIDERINMAFERGRGVGHDEAAVGPLAEGQARLEAHLEAQDLMSEARHEQVVKNGIKK